MECWKLLQSRISIAVFQQTTNHPTVISSGGGLALNGPIETNFLLNEGCVLRRSVLIGIRMRHSGKKDLSTYKPSLASMGTPVFFKLTSHPMASNSDNGFRYSELIAICLPRERRVLTL